MVSQSSSDSAADQNNVWRLDSPGAAGWKRTARAADPNKFFIVSADCHVQEPNDLWVKRMPKDCTAVCPASAFNPTGRNSRRPRAFARSASATCRSKARTGCATNRARRRKNASPISTADGVDCEVLFPNKGLAMWATPDAKFSQAMCHAYNEWAWEVFGPYNDKLAPMACIAAGDIEGAIAEVQRTAKLGFKGLSLPCKPVWGAPEPRSAELQPAGVRSAVGRDPGRGSADHVSRVDRPRSAHRARQRRRGDQLRRAFAGADDGTDREPVRVRRVGTISRRCVSAASKPASAGCRGR